MLFRSEQQRKPLGRHSEGFSIPDFLMEWLDSIGQLPAIYHHLTI